MKMNNDLLLLTLLIVEQIIVQSISGLRMVICILICILHKTICISTISLWLIGSFADKGAQIVKWNCIFDMSASESRCNVIFDMLISIHESIQKILTHPV